jgi:hypothetical protein
VCMRYPDTKVADMTPVVGTKQLISPKSVGKPANLLILPAPAQQAGAFGRT